jgi:hypothetical protein
MRGFVDDRNGLDLPVAKRGSNAIDSEWWETQDHDYQVGSPDETGQVGPRTSCRCQIIRSVSQWSAGTSQVEESIHSAYRSLIDKAEHFIYIEVFAITCVCRGISVLHEFNLIDQVIRASFSVSLKRPDIFSP